jgi:hypothetical protein
LFALLLGCKEQALFEDVAAKLVQTELYDLVNDLFDDVLLVLMQAELDDVRHHVVAELVQNQLRQVRKDLALHEADLHLVVMVLLQDPLHDTTAVDVLRELLNHAALGFEGVDDDLRVLLAHFGDYLLHDVIAVVVEHERHQVFLQQAQQLCLLKFRQNVVFEDTLHHATGVLVFAQVEDVAFYDFEQTRHLALVALV